MNIHQSNARRSRVCGAVFLLMIAVSTTTAQLKPTKPVSERPDPGAVIKASDGPIVVNSDLVTMTVSVTDARGQPVLGLDKQDFQISDNKVAQDIAFFSDEDIPASVAIVFDVSGSMSGQSIARAKEALSSFVQTSHRDDEYFLIGFNSRPQLLLGHTRDGDAIVRKLTYVEPLGQTALYDATYLAIAQLARGTRAKRVVLIISDGQDNNSRYSFGELRCSLSESDVLIYAIGFNNGGATERANVYGRLLLDELASVSGGKAFFPANSAQMNEDFERIAVELRHQYSIGYRPANFVVDGKWHRLKIKVLPTPASRRVFVRGREGYYATGTSFRQPRD